MLVHKQNINPYTSKGCYIYEDRPGNKVPTCKTKGARHVCVEKKQTIGYDLDETLRNETFELYLDVGFD